MESTMVVKLNVVTYIKIAGGMVYMAAIIDWHSKALLSYKISNTMDSQLVMSVLNDALEKYPHPEIFNTDQGSQYTSEIHTQRLKNLGITISMDGNAKIFKSLSVYLTGILTTLISIKDLRMWIPC